MPDSTPIAYRRHTESDEASPPALQQPPKKSSLIALVSTLLVLSFTTSACVWLGVTDHSEIQPQPHSLILSAFADGPLEDYTLRFLPVTSVQDYAGAIDFPDVQVGNKGWARAEFTSHYIGWVRVVAEGGEFYDSARHKRHSRSASAPALREPSTQKEGSIAPRLTSSGLEALFFYDPTHSPDEATRLVLTPLTTLQTAASIYWMDAEPKEASYHEGLALEDALERGTDLIGYHVDGSLATNPMRVAPGRLGDPSLLGVSALPELSAGGLDKKIIFEEISERTQAILSGMSRQSIAISQANGFADFHVLDLTGVLFEDLAHDGILNGKIKNEKGEVIDLVPPNGVEKVSQELFRRELADAIEATLEGKEIAGTGLGGETYTAEPLDGSDGRRAIHFAGLLRNIVENDTALFEGDGGRFDIRGPKVDVLSHKSGDRVNPKAPEGFAVSTEISDVTGIAEVNAYVAQGFLDLDAVAMMPEENLGTLLDSDIEYLGGGRTQALGRFSADYSYLSGQFGVDLEAVQSALTLSIVAVDVHGQKNVTSMYLRTDLTGPLVTLEVPAYSQQRTFNLRGEVAEADMQTLVSLRLVGPTPNNVQPVMDLLGAGGLASNVFSIDITVPEFNVGYSYSVVGEDSFGRVSPPNEFSWVADTLAPTAESTESFYLSSAQVTQSFSGHWVGSGNNRVFRSSYNFSPIDSNDATSFLPVFRSDGSAVDSFSDFDSSLAERNVISSHLELLSPSGQSPETFEYYPVLNFKVTDGTTTGVHSDGAGQRFVVHYDLELNGGEHWRQLCPVLADNDEQDCTRARSTGVYRLPLNAQTLGADFLSVSQDTVRELWLRIRDEAGNETIYQVPLKLNLTHAPVGLGGCEWADVANSTMGQSPLRFHDAIQAGSTLFTAQAILPPRVDAESNPLTYRTNSLSVGLLADLRLDHGDIENLRDASCTDTISAYDVLSNAFYPIPGSDYFCAPGLSVSPELPRVCGETVGTLIGDTAILGFSIPVSHTVVGLGPNDTDVCIPSGHWDGRWFEVEGEATSRPIDVLDTVAVVVRDFFGLPQYLNSPRSGGYDLGTYVSNETAVTGLSGQSGSYLHQYQWARIQSDISTEELNLQLTSNIPSASNILHQDSISGTIELVENCMPEGLRIFQ